MADALEHREHELSEAKEKAEESAARITTIFESTTDSVVIVDRDWRLSFLNGRALKQAEGRDPIGAKLSETVFETADPEIFSRLQEAMSNQHPVSFETYCSRLGAWYTINLFPSQPRPRYLLPRRHRTQVCRGGPPTGRGTASLAWVSRASYLLEVLEDALLLSEERVDGRGAAIRMEGLPSRIVALYHGVLTHTAGQQWSNVSAYPPPHFPKLCR